MSLTKVADRLITVLLFLSILAFAAALALYFLDSLHVTLPLSPKLIPDSLLATLVPPLTVLTIYELVRLAVSVRDPLVIFIRTLFQVVSVIMISDLLKLIAHLPTKDLGIGSLIEPGILLGASVLLYFFIELLERLEHRFLKSDHPKITSHLAPYRLVFAWVLLIYLIGFASYTAIGLFTGWPNVGFSTDYLSIVFTSFVIANVFVLLIALFFVKTYETLFEFFALVLASAIVLFALPQDTLPKVLMIFASLFFAITTLSLQGFARSEESDGGSEI